ncbi:helix-turn-helix domain-containing protein [Brachybacterium paraconglomeratum]|uniref:helix-turn-helix domain-containing protein n=1 Tax=Micrococcales TaxID=85006 RepID=UPI0008BFEE7F|nr:helix-turn-helix domain-containing protein [Brachybacterium sp. HMSC06H03]OFT57360.1 hypothetical protein HMPREF3159_08770 [Brachybacterium sp. HMSC06H03]
MHDAGSETYVAPNDEDSRGKILDLVAALHDRGVEPASSTALLTPDGKRHELPPELARVLHDVARALLDGRGVTITPRHQLLTTQEAADMLNISRPTLVKLLERGDLPFEMRGAHRRVRLDDLLTYEQSLRHARSGELHRMQEVSQEAGLYDLDGEPPVRR